MLRGEASKHGVPRICARGQLVITSISPAAIPTPGRGVQKSPGFTLTMLQGESIVLVHTFCLLTYLFPSKSQIMTVSNWQLWSVPAAKGT